jgi:uncharacterized protein involved in type VI secretion and phage assembly
MSIVNGVVIAQVTDVQADTASVKLNYPWLDPKHETDWARIATTMAGGGRGVFMMPEVGDEVLVAFEHGDTQNPYVVGFLWNGVDKTPGQDARDRKLVSRHGHTIRFLDSDDPSQNGIVIEDAGGNRITMTGQKMMIQAKNRLEIEAPAIYFFGPDQAPDDDSTPPKKFWARKLLPNNNTV